MAIDCANALAFLHSQDPPILHNDIKSPNYLVDGNGCVKLADLDLSCTVEYQRLNPVGYVPAALNCVAMGVAVNLKRNPNSKHIWTICYVNSIPDNAGSTLTFYTFVLNIKT
jgi:serine/threonine protein kinase